MLQEGNQNKNIGFFIIDYSTGGGVERVTANLMHQFYEKGFHNLHLISLKSDLQKPAMSYPELKSLKILSPSKKEFAPELSNWLTENGIDHLIFQGDNMTIALEVLKAAALAKIKAYPQYHGSPYAYLKKYSDAEKSNFEKILFANLVYPFKKNKLKRFINEAKDGLFCVSEGSANELKTVFKNDKEIVKRLKVIRNPVILKENHSFAKHKTIVLASRLESKHKNAFLAIKAWDLIAQKFPDWKMVVLGNGSLKDRMITFAQSKKINNVEFKGFVKDVDSELAKSSISICVSNCEGFNMSIAEAISHKNAIVSTDCDGGVKDMLINDKTALISPKNDAKLLAENISKMISDEALRIKLVENAYQRLKEISSQNPFEMWIKEMFG